jgi:hypothetical protein
MTNDERNALRLPNGSTPESAAFIAAETDELDELDELEAGRGHGGYDGWANGGEHRNMMVEQHAWHVPTPDDELEQGCYDVCKACHKPIRQDDAGLWRTMIGYSAECYGGSQS